MYTLTMVQYDYCTNIVCDLINANSIILLPIFARTIILYIYASALIYVQ